MFNKKIILILSILAGTFAWSSTSDAQPGTAYERGLQEIYSGNIDAGLDIWYSAYDNAEEVDSRIGFEFIRIVAENEMRSYYEVATEHYYKALLRGTGTESRVALRQEIKRMSPITGQGITRQWNEWWSNRNTELGTDMRGYWIQQDPTPANTANERLIEHWQRIAQAKNQFTKNNSTIYGTDDRALIYIRYGEPDRTRTGILTLQSANIKSWLENQLSRPATREEVENRPNDPELRDQQLANRLMDEMYRFHQYPEFEIWFYENIYESQQTPIIFLFGTDVRNNRFSLQTSLEDFIPERAFNPERDRGEDEPEFTRAGITPALMLQLLYYEQLAQIDPFFETRLNELQDNILEQGLEAFQGIDLSFRSQSRDLINKRITRAPVEKSTIQNILPKIPLQLHHYRFLSDASEPYLITYIESQPQEAFLIDYHRNREQNIGDTNIQYGTDILDQFPFYELSHSLQTYDEKWNIIESWSASPEVIIQSNPNGEVSRSYFKIDHHIQRHQSASVELLNINPDSRTVTESPFNPALRGWNKFQYRQPKPLSSDTDSLEVADLVLGYFEEGKATDPFSFTLANNQIVPFGKTLMLHFEVYHLDRMENGFTQFELTYRIFPVDKRGHVLRDQTEFVLTLNFTNEESLVTEDLEIETADLTPGLYELLVHITDTVTEQSKERVIRFEVMD